MRPSNPFRSSLVAAFLATAATAPLLAETPDQMLDRIDALRSAIKSVEFESTAVSGAGPLESTTKVHGWFEFNGGRKMRRIEQTMTMPNPETGAPVSTKLLSVSDGRVQWMEQRAEGRPPLVRKASAQADPTDPAEIRRQMRKRSAEVLPPTTVGGEPASVLRLTVPPKPGFSAQATTIFYSDKTGYVLRIDTRRGDEKVESMNFKYIAFDADIDDAKFAYEPPPDAEVRDVSGGADASRKQQDVMDAMKMEKKGKTGS